MKILVINAGSSSLKYQLIDMENEKTLAKGNCERIGLEESFLTYKTSNGIKKTIHVDLPNHTKAFEQVEKALQHEEYGVIKSIEEISAVGHRIVQGGAKFLNSILVTNDVINGIEELIPLAPLHNHAHVQGIKACINTFGEEIPQVVVFDTAFHSTMPEKAYLYPIPYEYYEKYQIRRYGFHGTSHKYVSHRCAELLNKDIKDLKIITCHLGNGSSICAINKGKVIDTSMGLTPLDGFMMGTRSGSLDPSVVTFIEGEENLTPGEMNEILNKESGLLGISGVSSDDREVTAAAENGNSRAILAHEMLRYQVAKFIGGYVAALNGCDAIVFTAGLGENNAKHRASICAHLGYLGVKINEDVNNETIKGKENKISTPESKVSVLAIPTNEELMIARDTKIIVEKL